MSESVELMTSDGIRLAAHYYEAEEHLKAAVLVHMMPATKESWAELAEYLKNRGISSLAIDLRGHGSSQGGPSGYQEFNPDQHQKSHLDVEAAVNFLKTRTFSPEKIAFVGASIGANLCLEYLALHKEYKSAVLISPGRDYRGIKGDLFSSRLNPGQKVFFIASRGDPSGGSDNAEQNEFMYSKIPDGVLKKIKIEDGGKHGTAMLEVDRSLIQEIYEFIR